MEAGCPGTWGLELQLLTPNPNSQNTQEPTLIATQPRASPARKNPAPAPNTRHTELEEQWKTYWVNDE